MIGLSIVIPSHNRPDLLERCLVSLRSYAPAGTEVLVVDDASAGRQVTAVARRFAEVGVLRLKRRGGFCAAVNAGLRFVHRDVVELLNDDTEVTPGWAEAALAHFADPAVGAVAPLALRWPGGEEATIDSAGDYYHLGGVAGKRGRGRRLSAELLQPGRVFGASASTAFYRRSALLGIGAFPEHFGAYFEDVDVAFRLHRAGYQVRYEPAARVLHRVSASHGQPRRELLEQHSANEERVFWRNVPPRQWPRAVPRHLAVLAAKAWLRLEEGNLLPFLLGRLRLVGELPELVRHRRRLKQLGPDRPLDDWGVEARLFDLLRR
jgi:GT2 family glycosyltransferase